MPQRSFGKGKKKSSDNKGVKLFSKEQLKRDLENGILNTISDRILENGSLLSIDSIPILTENVVRAILKDSAMIFVLDKLFGSHKTWDYLYKMIIYLYRTVALILFTLSRTEQGSEYIEAAKVFDAIRQLKLNMF